MDHIFTLQDLHYAYPDGTQALCGIELAIPRGSKTVIIGANGSGKSTLLLHLNGILQPSRGTVFFQGTPVTYTHPCLAQLRQTVGLVFQDPEDQIFSSNVYQDIAFGPLNLQLPRSEIERRTTQAMALTGTAHLAQRPTHLLSFGEKKRVAIAGVLAMHPEVMIFDEPTAGLDPKLSEEMLVLLENLHHAGATLICSTHDMDFAFGWADNCIVLSRGRVAAAGSAEEVFQDTTLLGEHGLCEPVVQRVFREVIGGSMPGSSQPVPKTLEMLIRLLQAKI